MAYYAEIVHVGVQTEAREGEIVDILVGVKNLYTSTIGILIGGALEYGVTPWPGITFVDTSYNTPAGATHYFSGAFTMPNKEVKVHVYSYYYGVDSGWHFDDEEVRTVKLSALAPEFDALKITDYERR